MSETATRTATKISDAPSFNGDASLYRLSEPIIEPGRGGDAEAEHSFVIVSAITAAYTGPETYIFAATEDGEVLSWNELEGSFRGALDHAAALRGAGYEVTP